MEIPTKRVAWDRCELQSSEPFVQFAGRDFLGISIRKLAAKASQPQAEIIAIDLAGAGCSAILDQF